MTSEAEYQASRRFLAAASARDAPIENPDAWRRFRQESVTREWLYLMRFSVGVYAWGTCSNQNDRIRKSSLLDPKLTGKYDRRVDYLMLKVIFGQPTIHVFEAAGATGVEAELRTRFGQRHCYRGLAGGDREEISRRIVEAFRDTPHFRGLARDTQDGFEQYLNDVFFARRRHPKNPSRTFFWGDSLEPGFLRTVGLTHLERPVEEALRVCF